MKINTILIDDENKAIATLKNKLERFCPNIIVIAQTQCPKEGIELINTLKPELVFLDIAMPGINGFDVLSQIENPNFEVIFATAFDNYAIEAINRCAIGYLVKPVDNLDLVKVVNNAVLNIEKKSAFNKNKQLLNNLDEQNFCNKKIIVPSLNGLEFLKISDIIYFQGNYGYTNIYFSNREPILSSNSIGHFKKILEDKCFYLIHKSYLINLNFIDKYINEGYVVLRGNLKLPVSRNKRQDFLSSLKE